MNHCKISTEGEPLCWVISSESICDYYQPNNMVGWQNSSVLKRRCQFEMKVWYETVRTKYLCVCSEAVVDVKMREL